MPNVAACAPPPFVTLRCRVLGVTYRTPSVFVLRFERNGLRFIPGQRLLVGRGLDMREYSIFSSPADAYLEILVKLIAGGAVSPMLASLSEGDEVDVQGPQGDFLRMGSAGGRRLFVATGTGIAPYRSLARDAGGLEYRLIHGIRHSEDTFREPAFAKGRYVACVSRGGGGDFDGRVSDWLETHPVEPDTECYLCGNSDMIYDCFRILSGYGIPRERVHAEIYF